MIKILLILLCGASLAFAEHIYMAQSALGNGDGTSAANAKAAYTFFNTAANWDALVNTTNGKIGPGDTVHIVGTINVTGASATSSNQLTFQGGGTPGNPITLKFDVGGQIRHPHGFPTGLITGIGSGIHDIIIEGANTSVSMKTGAFVQKDLDIFANGTAQANQVANTRIVYIDSAGSNITIRGLYMYGAYVRTHNHTSDLTVSSNIITFRGQDDLVIDNCRAEYGEGGIGVTGLGTQNTGLRITNNYIYGTSTGVKIGTVVGGFNDGAVIAGNRIDGFAAWAGLQSPNQHHCDGIQTITPGGAVTLGNGEHRNYIVSHNHIGPDLGLYGSMNAHIFLEDNVNGVRVFNNLLTANSTPINPLQTSGSFPNGIPPGTANGFIEFGQNTDYFNLPGGIRSLIANNTVYGGGAGKGIVSSYARVEGNIVTNLLTISDVWANQPDNANGRYAIFEKNVYFNSNGTYQFGGNRTFAQWQAAGWDTNSITQNPQVTFATGALASTSAAIGFAPTQTVFTDDLNQATRTVPWDAGAVEFGATADTTAPTPNPMTFASNPAAVDAFSVTMTATTATDAGGTVSYFFDETSGVVGGTDSGWQTSPTYVDTGLSPATLYTYRVKARDPSMNETSYSGGANATTPAGPGGAVNIETLNVGNLRVGQ